MLRDIETVPLASSNDKVVMHTPIGNEQLLALMALDNITVALQQQDSNSGNKMKDLSQVMLSHSQIQYTNKILCQCNPFVILIAMSTS